MISIYERNQTDFSKNGIAVLEDAKDICIQREINGDYTLDFSMPPCEKWKQVIPERIVKVEGQLFRVKTISGMKVSCAAIYYDCSRKHIQYIPNLIGYTPRDIMTTIFADYGFGCFNYRSSGGAWDGMGGKFNRLFRGIQSNSNWRPANANGWNAKSRALQANFILIIIILPW